MANDFILLRLNPLELNVDICGLSCHQKVLKAFSGHDYLYFEDRVVWLWHLLVNSAYMTHHSILLPLNPFKVRVDNEGFRFEPFLS